MNESQHIAGPKRRISKRLSQAIEFYYTGQESTKKQAALRAKLTPEHFCRALGMPHVRAYLAMRAAEILATAAPKAAAKLEELMNCASLNVQEKAASRILAIGGYVPADRPNLQVNIGTGYIVNLSGVPTDEALAGHSGAVVTDHGPAGMIIMPSVAGKVVEPDVEEARDAQSRGLSNQTIEYQDDGGSDAGKR